MIDKRKPKITIFHCGFIYSGGGERIVLEQAKGLMRRGYDVEVYAPTLDKKRCYPELVRQVGVKTFFTSFFNKIPYRNALRMLASSIFAPVLSARFKDTDIFIGANQPGSWIAFCMAKVLNKPYLVYLNQPNRIVYPRPVDVEYEWASTETDYQFLYKFFQIIKPVLSILDKISIRSANNLLVNGEHIGTAIENVYAKRTINTPAGAYSYSLEKLFLNPHTAYKGKIKVAGKVINKPFLLITNRHDPQKRFDFVISAMSHVSKEFKNVSLVIPGPFTKHTKQLNKQAKDLGLEENILFLGKISEKDLQKLYRHATIYCYPSPEEDFGLGPIEAGGWGVPTVAWNHGGPTVTVEHGVTGFLAKPYNVDDFAAAILKLLNNQKLRAKMGKAAWKRTKDTFSWDSHINILENSFLKISQKSRSKKILTHYSDLTP